MLEHKYYLSKDEAGVDALFIVVLLNNAVHEVVVLIPKGGGGRGRGGHHVTAKRSAHHGVGEAGVISSSTLNIMVRVIQELSWCLTDRQGCRSGSALLQSLDPDPKFFFILSSMKKHKFLERIKP